METEQVVTPVVQQPVEISSQPLYVVESGDKVEVVRKVKQPSSSQESLFLPYRYGKGNRGNSRGNYNGRGRGRGRGRLRGRGRPKSDRGEIMNDSESQDKYALSKSYDIKHKDSQQNNEESINCRYLKVVASQKKTSKHESSVELSSQHPESPQIERNNEEQSESIQASSMKKKYRSSIDRSKVKSNHNSQNKKESMVEEQEKQIEIKKKSERKVKLKKKPIDDESYECQEESQISHKQCKMKTISKMPKKLLLPPQISTNKHKNRQPSSEKSNQDSQSQQRSIPSEQPQLLVKKASKIKPINSSMLQSRPLRPQSNRKTESCRRSLSPSNKRSKRKRMEESSIEKTLKLNNLSDQQNIPAKDERQIIERPGIRSREEFERSYLSRKKKKIAINSRVIVESIMIRGQNPVSEREMELKLEKFYERFHHAPCCSFSTKGNIKKKKYIEEPDESQLSEEEKPKVKVQLPKKAAHRLKPELQQQEPVKKKRGRPKKNQPKKIQIEEVQEQQSEAPRRTRQSNKRGRVIKDSESEELVKRKGRSRAKIEEDSSKPVSARIRNRHK